MATPPPPGFKGTSAFMPPASRGPPVRRGYYLNRGRNVSQQHQQSTQNSVSANPHPGPSSGSYRNQPRFNNGPGDTGGPRQDPHQQGQVDSMNQQPQKTKTACSQSGWMLSAAEVEQLKKDEELAQKLQMQEDENAKKIRQTGKKNKSVPKWQSEVNNYDASFPSLAPTTGLQSLMTLPSVTPTTGPQNLMNVPTMTSSQNYVGSPMQKPHDLSIHGVTSGQREEQRVSDEGKNYGGGSANHSREPGAEMYVLTMPQSQEMPQVETTPENKVAPYAGPYDAKPAASLEPTEMQAAMPQSLEIPKVESNTESGSFQFSAEAVGNSRQPYLHVESSTAVGPGLPAAEPEVQQNLGSPPGFSVNALLNNKKGAFKAEAEASNGPICELQMDNRPKTCPPAAFSVSPVGNTVPISTMFHLASTISRVHIVTQQAQDLVQQLTSTSETLTKLSKQVEESLGTVSAINTLGLPQLQEQVTATREIIAKSLQSVVTASIEFTKKHSTSPVSVDAGTSPQKELPSFLYLHPQMFMQQAVMQDPSGRLTIPPQFGAQGVVPNRAPPSFSPAQVASMALTIININRKVRTFSLENLEAQSLEAQLLVCRSQLEGMKGEEATSAMALVYDTLRLLAARSGSAN